MRLPAPAPGLVIRYSYLWRREAVLGREEGAKDRPCAVVLVVFDDAGRRRVRVLPITHAPPAVADDAVEIPMATAKRLELDGDRSWIVLTEANDFVWPGPDLRPARRADPASVAFGFLPPKLFRAVRERLIERYRAGRLAAVPRSE